MSSIRRYVYAALLALSTLNFAPTLVSAQEPAHGRFILPHDVHWENAIVPAGEYQFSLESGTIGVLRLNKLNGAHAGFMFLVHDQEPSKSADLSRILMDKTPSGSYVSAMQLPDFGITLNFKVSASTTEKQIASTATMRSSSGQ